MPLKKLCSKCGKVMPYGKAMCDECEAKYKSTRHKEYQRDRKDKDIQRFYASTDWIVVRDFTLQRDHYLCQHCLENNIINSTNLLVHHKKEIKTPEGWEERFNIDGLITLCSSCHQKEHNKNG